MHIMYCADKMKAGQGRAGQGRAGQGRAGQCQDERRAEQAMAGQDEGRARQGKLKPGQGRAGQDMAGQDHGRAGQNMAGQVQGKARHDISGQDQAKPETRLRQGMMIPVLMPQTVCPSCPFCLLQQHLPKLLLPATQPCFTLFTMSMRWPHSHCAQTLLLTHCICVKHMCLLE